MHRILAVFACLACFATAACSSTTSPSAPADAGGAEGDAGCGLHNGQCVPCTSTADLTTPAVTFGHDVQPVFQQSCSIAGATCHGARNVQMQGRPFLGLQDGGADAADILSGIVGKPSVEDPQMNILTASDPGNSYLMHKVDGDQCTLAAACAKGTSQYPDCGQQMPYSSPPLDTSTRDTIRRWIAQGAKP